MTSRPRPKRTTSDSSSSSSSAKGGKKKTSTRRRSAGGAAEKRPPRVSLPPTMGAGAPKKKPAVKAPAPKPAPKTASKPAPKSEPRKAAPAKSAQSSSRSSAPQRSAAQRPPERTNNRTAPAPQPQRAQQPRPQQQSPRAPVSDRPAPPSSTSRAPAPAPQAQAPRPPAQPQSPAPRPAHQQPQGEHRGQGSAGSQRPAQPPHLGVQGRPPQQGGFQQQRPQGQQQPQRPPQGPSGQGGRHDQGHRPHSGGGNNQHFSQGRPPQQQQQQRPQQQHQQTRPQQQQNQPHGQHQQPRHPQHQQRHDGQPGQHGQHGSHGQHNRPQHDQRPQAPHAPAPHTPPAAPAPAPKQQIGNAAPEGFNQKAFEEIFEKDIPFSQLGLNEWLLKGITEAGFVYPTSIQAKLIPTILTGRDVLGQAKTGTGKTAAFALPMLNAIGKGESFGGLVLVPTRELALQVAADFRELGKYTGLNVLPVYGGQNIATQAKALSHGPEIIVATPGRVMDMAERGYLHHHNVKMVVLDEVDRMLDIGFRDDIKRILSACPAERQTVFVSATMQPEIEQLARTFARDCEKIIASAGALTVAMVKQFYLPVEPWDKKQLLLHLLTHESPALTVVFCRTKRTVDNLTEYLGRKGIDAHAIHGDMQQGKRNRVIEQLRSGKLAVLIASDLASRGLDVEGITHVINYDLPEDPDLYVHRIGRTARAGRDGVAWALVTPEQGDLLTQIEHLINAEIPKLDYPDFKPGPLPADVLAEREAVARRAEQSKSFNRFAQSFHAPAAGGAPADAAPGGGAPAPVIRPAYAAPAPAAALDVSKFPGGIVPSKMPPRLMYGKVRSARSMRQAPPPPAPGAGTNAET